MIANLSTDFLNRLPLTGKCPQCGSDSPQVTDAAPPHGQKVTCSDCGRFVRWLPSSQNIERHRNLKDRLKALQGRVNGWDSAFVNNLIEKIRIAERAGKIFKLSPRQSEQLQRIEEKFSLKNISSGN